MRRWTFLFLLAAGTAGACPQALLDAEATARVAPILYDALQPFHRNDPVKFERGFWAAEVPHLGSTYAIFHDVNDQAAPLLVFRKGGAFSRVPLQHLTDLSSILHQTYQDAVMEQLAQGWGAMLALFYEQEAVSWEDSLYLLDGRQEKLRMPVFPTVFPPVTLYTRTMLETALETARPGERVLVMGCGSGVEAVALAKHRGLKVDCVDINPLAVANANAAALVHGVADQVSSWQSDLFLRVGQRYDRIYFDSPLAVPPNYDLGDGNLSDPGAVLLTRFLREVRSYLRPAGSAYLMSWPHISGVAPANIKTEKRRSFQDESGAPFAIHQIQAN